jgi:trehalose 6-phosphate phosphatase
VPYVFEHLDLIEKLLRQSPFGLIVDVDGTISETAPTPQQASVSPLCRHYLSLLCPHLALVAAVSGRPAAQVRDMIGIDGMVYLGNHGLERWTEGHSELTEEAEAYSKIISSIVEKLPRLLSTEGIIIEDKRLTASIHFRLHPEPESAKRAILAALQQLPQVGELRVIQGRKTVDLLPPAANKGTAILDLIKMYSLRGGVYLGDDFTDIDAFRAIRAASRDLDFHGFAVGVISQEMPESFVAEADFTLNGVSDVERFLEWMFQIVVPPS